MKFQHRARGKTAVFHQWAVSPVKTTPDTVGAGLISVGEQSPSNGASGEEEDDV